MNYHSLPKEIISSSQLPNPNRVADSYLNVYHEGLTLQDIRERQKQDQELNRKHDEVLLEARTMVDETGTGDDPIEVSRVASRAAKKARRKQKTAQEKEAADK